VRKNRKYLTFVFCCVNSGYDKIANIGIRALLFQHVSVVISYGTRSGKHLSADAIMPSKFNLDFAFIAFLLCHSHCSIGIRRSSGALNFEIRDRGTLLWSFQ
jgi:hypothetical protein